MQDTNIKFFDILNRSRRVIMRSIDPTSSFIYGLSEKSGLSSTDIKEIERKSSADAKNSCLLDILSRQPGDVMDKVISILKENNQEHVAALLCGETATEKLPMSDDHYERLLGTSNTMRLFLDLEGGLIENLVSKRMLIWIDKERVDSKPTVADKASELISILMRKADGAFDEFIWPFAKPVKVTSRTFSSETTVHQRQSFL